MLDWRAVSDQQRQWRKRKSLWQAWRSEGLQVVEWWERQGREKRLGHLVVPHGGWCWIAAVVCRAAFPKLGQSLQPFRALLKNKKSRAPPQTYPNRIHILKNLPTRFWDTPLKTAALTQLGRIEIARFCDSFLVEGETEERKKMRSFLWVR